MKASETAFFNRLTEAVGGLAEVWLNEAPQEEATPVVVFELGLRNDSAGTAPILTGQLRTAVLHPDHEACEALADLVKVALQDWRFGAPGLRIGPVDLANQDGDYAEQWNEHRIVMLWNTPIIEWAVA